MTIQEIKYYDIKANRAESTTELLGARGVIGALYSRHLKIYPPDPDNGGLLGGISNYGIGREREIGVNAPRTQLFAAFLFRQDPSRRAIFRLNSRYTIFGSGRS